jgi:ferrochelatase
LFAVADAPVPVELAMTYGKPSIDDAIEKLLSKGARQIITLPLYPQYSTTTTAAVFDLVTRQLSRRNIGSCFVDSYHDLPEYIAALATSVRESWEANGRGDMLLMSFHGVPISTLKDGDPYHRQCQKTAALLADRLGLNDDEWMIAFQSRVGREEWLAPTTDATIKELGKRGLSRIDVVCPGFAVDCLETLEEIAMQNADFFIESGGDSLHYIPALNARDDHVGLLAALVHRCTEKSDDLAAAS